MDQNQQPGAQRPVNPSAPQYQQPAQPRPNPQYQQPAQPRPNPQYQQPAQPRPNPQYQQPAQPRPAPQYQQPTQPQPNAYPQYQQAQPQQAQQYQQPQNPYPQYQQPVQPVQIIQPVVPQSTPIQNQNVMVNISGDQVPTGKYAPLSPWAYFGLSLLFSIPFVGFVFLIIFSISDGNINRRNYARSYWCLLIIVVIIIAIMAAAGFSFAALFSGSVRR